MSDTLSDVLSGAVPSVASADVHIMTGATAAPVAPETSDTVLTVDRFTRHRASVAANAWTAAGIMVGDDAVAADAFATAFEPNLRTAERPADASRATWWRQLLASPELASLRASTVAKVALADIAAAQLAQQWTAYAAEHPAPEPRESGESGDSAQDGQPDGADGADGNAQDGQQEDGADIAADVERIASVRQALKAAQEAAETAEATAAGLGLGDASTVDASALRAAYAQVMASPLLRAIMDAAGRWTAATMNAQRTRADAQSGEIVGVTLGGNMANALPIQAALAAGAVPELEMLYLARLATRGLLSYKRELRRPQSRGPLVVSVDESGSMNGDRIIQAKGLALALCHLARVQHRPITLCAWSGTDYVRAQDGHGNPADVLNWVTSQLGGGTCLDAPLATVPAKHWPAGDIGARADHIIISDGEAYAVPETVAQYRAWSASLNVRTFALMIDATGAGGLADVADVVIPMHNLTPDAIRHVLGSL